MKQEETIDFQIRRTWHHISRMYQAEAAKYGSSMSVGFVLLSIDQKKGTPSTKLGPKMGMEASSLTRTLKNMEEKGLIQRIPDECDKRVMRIYLTDEGKKKRSISRQTVLNFNRIINKNVSKRKLDTFFEVIEEVNQIIDHQKSQHNNE